MESLPIIPVHVITLVEDPSNPVLFLYCQGENRIIPVLIGPPEAKILALALDKVNFERPLTHSLLLSTIEAMGGQLSRIVIYDVAKDIFYAKICVKIGEGQEEIQIDARPSDALILAVQAIKPIFVTKTVMDKAGQKSPIIQQPSAHQGLTQKEITELKKHLTEAQQREQTG